jgi:hypothetical protein
MNITKKKNNIPLRRCLVTGEQWAKSSLIRMVKTLDGQLVVDLTGRINGRGAYLKKDANLIPLLLKDKYLSKLFGIEPTPAFIESLKKAIHG